VRTRAAYQPAARVGLIVEDAQTGRTLRGEIPVVAVPDTGRPCDFVLVAVRRDQMVGTLSLLSDLDADVMFFGNAAGLTAQLTGALGRRTMFGFPAAGGISDGATASRWIRDGSPPTTT
jgi:hypothetical protein